MNTFTKKKLHAELLETLLNHIQSIDEDIKTDFDYHNDLLSKHEDEKYSYSYEMHSKKLEEINEKLIYLEKILKHLEKIDL